MTPSPNICSVLLNSSIILRLVSEPQTQTVQSPSAFAWERDSIKRSGVPGHKVSPHICRSSHLQALTVAVQAHGQSKHIGWDLFKYLWSLWLAGGPFPSRTWKRMLIVHIWLCLSYGFYEHPVFWRQLTGDIVLFYCFAGNRKSPTCGAAKWVFAHLTEAAKLMTVPQLHLIHPS